MSPQEAERQREPPLEPPPCWKRSREAWMRPLAENLWADARFAIRQRCGNSGFALTTILTLALGIGATTAIFSLANAVLLRPLPFQKSDLVVRPPGDPARKEGASRTADRSLNESTPVYQVSTLEDYGLDMAASIAVIRLLSEMLVGARPSGPATFVATAGLLLLVGLAATPSLHAAQRTSILTRPCENNSH